MYLLDVKNGEDSIFSIVDWLISRSASVGNDEGLVM